MEAVCQQFRNDPTINPHTGRKIKQSGPVYNKLLQECNLYHVIITYQPLPTPQIHRRNLLLNIDEINGLHTITTMLNLPITINHVQIPIIQDQGAYTALINSTNVQFQHLDFLQGVFIGCMLCGYDCNTTIQNIYHNGIHIQPIYKFYIAGIDIPDPTDLFINELGYYIGSELTESIIDSMDDCFHLGNNIGIFPFTNIYIITPDIERSSVAAVSMGTPIENVDLNMQIQGAYYIYNVCVPSKYRRSGLGKTVMITLMQDMIERGINKFVLEVDPNNISAYMLYQSLGFEKVGHYSGYDIMMVNI